ncbi:hypothetical protein CSIM01_06663 [Colletotrichum simmondsii]|uniref:Uncharacterized protein n=1 Tax=Colletotrichum simmondsii TaxID=703756 RepID=A0A135SUM6_9PEZI|nr:hypothetical protein CSIM01_06663 [Colletotrichum simmondsii]
MTSLASLLPSHDFSPQVNLNTSFTSPPHFGNIDIRDWKSTEILVYISMPPTHKGRKANSGPSVPAIASPSAERFSTHQLKVIEVCLRQTGFDFRCFACGTVAEVEWDALKLLHLDFALPTADPSLTMTASRLTAIIHAAAQCLESSHCTTRDAAFWKEVKNLLSDDSTFQAAPISDFVKFDNILYRYYSAWVSFRDQNPGMSRTLIQEPYTTSAESKAAHQLHLAMCA